MTRRAISPRLAIRMRWNMDELAEVGASRSRDTPEDSLGRARDAEERDAGVLGLDEEQNLTVFHRIAVLDQDFSDGPGDIGFDGIEELHGLDQADDRV